MFKEKYEEYNADIVPKDDLLERTLEKAGGNAAVKPRISGRKIAAAAACAVFAVGALTISVDAATDGAVRKMFGFADSAVYDELNDTQSMYQNEDGSYVIQSGEAGSEGAWEMTTYSDSPVFILNFKLGENNTYSYSKNFADYMTDEDIIWDLYSGLCDFLYTSVGLCDENQAEIVEKLQNCADSIGNACYKESVELVIADIQNGKHYLIEWIPIIAEADYSDPETELVIEGCAWIKIDPDTVQFEEDGTAYIETQSAAGVPLNIGITVRKSENGLETVSMSVIE